MKIHFLGFPASLDGFKNPLAAAAALAALTLCAAAQTGPGVVAPFADMATNNTANAPSSSANDNTPPPGFVALFNGRDLAGWKGLVADPPKRAAMAPAELATAQAKADQLMLQNWKVENGTLVYRGDGYDNLCTAKDYADFELLADWRIAPYSDSGIYLRGSPQVQIWDPYTQPTRNGSEVGSGGLYNNQKNPANPLKVADKPVGEWNHFRIVMIGGKVDVFLNGVQVVKDTTLENYWDRAKPIYPTGQLELQAHKSPAWFKNIYLREIPRP